MQNKSNTIKPSQDKTVEKDCGNCRPEPNKHIVVDEQGKCVMCEREITTRLTIATDKSKVENGEVIEAFDKEFEVYQGAFEEMGILTVQPDYEPFDIPKTHFPVVKIKAFITNALNQQRDDILKLIDKIELSYRDTTLEEWKAFKHIRNGIRDLTKLEK